MALALNKFSFNKNRTMMMLRGVGSGVGAIVIGVGAGVGATVGHAAPNCPKKKLIFKRKKEQKYGNEPNRTGFEQPVVSVPSTQLDVISHLNMYANSIQQFEIDDDDKEKLPEAITSHVIKFVDALIATSECRTSGRWIRCRCCSNRWRWYRLFRKTTKKKTISNR